MKEWGLSDRSKNRRERKHPRFLISRPEVMRGAIGPLTGSFVLLTFGEGGAGFLALAGAKVMTPPIDVTCTFECRRLKLESFRVEAYLLYSFESYEQRGLSGQFYGVEFKNKKQPEIVQVISILEDLALKSQIEIEAKDV